MTRDSGKKSVGSELHPDAADELRDDEPGGSLNTVPDWMRRLVAAGLSGFFLTEEAFRKALGDTLPRDWSDFAVEQSERTRRELLERLSAEIGRTLENVDVADVLSRLLAGSTIDLKAEIRLRPNPAGSDAKPKSPPKG